MKRIFWLLPLYLLQQAHAAEVAGKVVYMSGMLTAQQQGGAVRVLAPKSEVLSGDVLRSEDDTFAQISLTDGGQVTLRPNSTVNIQDYRFKKEKPADDNVVFNLLKGGMRTVSGMIGKRGNRDAYKIKTVTATIGIRGSSGDTVDCTSGGSNEMCANIPAGVYHATYHGAYIISNDKGTQLVKAGEFGYAAAANTPPALLQQDPGFNKIPMPFATGDTPASKPKSQCEVK